MNLLQHWYPGDAAVEFIGRLFVEIGLVVGLATLFAVIAVRHRPAARHALWLAVLATVGLSPLTLFGLQKAGWNWSIRRPTGLAKMQPESAHPGFPVAAEIPIETSGAAADEKSVGHDTSNVGEGADPVRSRLARSHRVVESTTIDVRRAIATAGAFIWLAGAIFLLGRLLLGQRQVRRLLSDVQPIALGRMAQSLEIPARTLRVESLPPIVISPAAAGPVVAGLLRPTIVLPADFVGQVGTSELADVLVHECAHVLRRDLWVGMLQRLAHLAFWPHPFIYLMNRSLSRAREEVCDNYVLRRADPVGYAQTLLELAQHSRGHRLPDATLAIFSPRWNLEERVAGLLDPRRRHKTHIGRGLSVLALIALITGGSLIAGIRFDETRQVAGAVSQPRRSPDGMLDPDTARPTGTTGAADDAASGENGTVGDTDGVTGSDLKAVLDAYEKGVRKILSYDITYRAQETNLLNEVPDPERQRAQRESKQGIIKKGEPANPLAPVRYTAADPAKAGRTLLSRQYYRNGSFRIECLRGFSGEFDVGQHVVVWNGESKTSFNGRAGTALVQSTANDVSLMGQEVPHYELFYRMAFGDNLYSKIINDRDSTCAEKDGLIEIEALPAPTRLVNLNTYGWRLWLDPRANHLPRRITLTIYRNEKIVNLTQIDNTLDEVRPGVWFPVEAVVSFYVSLPDSPQFAEKTGFCRYTLDRELCQFNVAVDGDLFDLRLPKGTVVTDRRIVIDGPQIALSVVEGPPLKPELESGRLLFGAQLQTTTPLTQQNSTALVEANLETGRTRLHQFDGFYRTPRISTDGQTVIYPHASWFRGFNLTRVPWYRNFAGGINGDVQALWLPDGKSIVVSSYKEPREGVNAWETFKVNLDGSEKTVLPIPETEMATDISRDGQWLVTCSNRHPPNRNRHQIYIMRLDGTQQRRLTQDAGNSGARISPDGQRVAYVRHDKGATELRIINFDGTGERTILSSDGAINAIDSVAWSPGGQRIAVIRSAAGDAKYRLEIVYVDDGTLLRLGLENTDYVTLSGIDWR